LRSKEECNDPSSKGLWGPLSRTMGVSAPLRCEGLRAGEELDGDVIGEGVVMLLAELLPRVAAIEGEAGGSGERVK